MKIVFDNLRHKRLVYLVAIILVLGAGTYIFKSYMARGAVFSFTQTDWSGGSDLLAFLQHPGDQTGTTKFASKDDNVQIGTAGEISLSATTSSLTETVDGDFSGTKTNVYAGGDALALSKPQGISCATGNECSSGWCAGNGTCELCDGFTLDGQNYNVMIIGSQCWMKENLAAGAMVFSSSTGASHSEQSNNGVVEKYCYNNAASNCTTYGALYDWNELMAYSTTPGAQGICPVGWHIPTSGDWHALETYISTSTCGTALDVWECDSVASQLKVGGGIGFNFLFGGTRDYSGFFASLENNAMFWTSNQLDANDSASIKFDIFQTGVRKEKMPKAIGYSARCIKN
jgi:uncharacterized protein (TIGR02145 family)